MFTRFVIIFLLLTTIGSRGVADEFKDGDVFYCETEGLADFDKGNDWELRSYQDQKFKFKICFTHCIFIFVNESMLSNHFIVENSIKFPHFGISNI